jgi:16S rRNA processing protein RimM
MVPAGRVGRPHGLDGSFHVTRPVAALLDEGAVLEVQGQPLRVERRAGSAEKPILRLEGCSSREQVEALRGADLLAPRSAAPPLEKDEFWAEDLQGCTVVDGEHEVGVVTRMIALPSCEALEVAGAGPEFLVPLVRDAVRSVDVERREIDVDMAFLEGG